MRNQRLLKISDIAIIINITLFAYVSYQLLDVQFLGAMLSAIVALFNLAYLLGAIRLRKNYNLKLEKELEYESRAEEMISVDDKEVYRKTKQNHLENIITLKLEEAFPNMKIIRNAFVPLSNGKDAQVDLIALHEKGIFVIESKNITGKITGAWNSDKIDLIHPGGKTYSMINPIKQNAMHVERLSSILGKKPHYFKNLIVLGDTVKSELWFRGIPDNTRIAFPTNIIKKVNEFINKTNFILSKGEIEIIYDDLTKVVKADKEREEKHIKSLQAKKDQ